MARIVPAKPKMKDQDLENILMSMQSTLGEEVVIIQNKPSRGEFLILAPGRRPCFVRVAEKAYELDLDAREVAGGPEIDLDTLCEEYLDHAAALEIGTEFDIRLVTPAIDASHREETEAGSLVIGKDAVNVSPMLNEGAFEATRINDILQALYPGASPYIAGDLRPASETPMAAALNLEDPVPVPGFDAAMRAIKTKRPFALIPVDEKSDKRVAYVETMVSRIIDRVAKEKNIFLAGIAVDAEFLAKRDNYLPILLICAAIEWGSVVAKTKGVGGFDLRLSRDPNSLAGVRVKDILLSSPFLFFCNIKRVVAMARYKGELDFDNLTQIADRWFDAHDVQGTSMEDIEINVALSSIED